jgi:hypothetical protein
MEQIRLAEDQVESLVIIYNRMLHKEFGGKLVSDVAQVFDQLKDWRTLAEAEFLIPFKFAEKKKQPIGYRIWSLSRHSSELYYAGDFFDCVVSVKNKRCVRKRCRLSEAAIEFFSRYQQVKENKIIEGA